MSTKKAIGISFVAIFILIIAQIIAQVIASVFVIIKIPYGICNIIAGIIYVGLTYLILKMFISKIVKLPVSDFGMPKFEIKIRWILIAILLPCIIKGIYVLIFNGEYVSSNMNGNEMFNTLSAGVAFTGIAAGFVEEMVFRGVILNALKKRWNMKVAVIVPSMLFGIVHVLGQDFSIGSCLLVIIAGTMVGVMFSMIAIESGSVWNSGIVHAIWNIVIIGGGLAIGEKMDPYSVMTYVLYHFTILGVSLYHFTIIVRYYLLCLDINSICSHWVNSLGIFNPITFYIVITIGIVAIKLDSVYLYFFCNNHQTQPPSRYSGVQ